MQSGGLAGWGIIGVFCVFLESCAWRAVSSYGCGKSCVGLDLPLSLRSSVVDELGCSFAL